MNLGELVNNLWTQHGSEIDIEGDDNTAAVAQTLLNNAQSAYNTNITNAANLRIHQLDNSFNAEQAELGRSFEREMWNATNAYNTPEMQKQRYLAAGLNPIAMMSGQGAAGNASNVGGAPTAAAGSPPTMQSPQLFSNSFSNHIPELISAFTNVANAGKGFADTMLDLGRLENESGLARSQNALNMAKALEARESAKATSVNTVSVVPATLRNMLADYEATKAKTHKTKAEEVKIGEETRAIGAQVWKWISDYDIGLRNVMVQHERNQIDATGNPWKIGMDFMNKTGLTKKIENFISGNTEGLDLNEILGSIRNMPRNIAFGAWNTFKDLVSERNLGLGHYLFTPVVKIGEAIMNRIDEQTTPRSGSPFIPSNFNSVLNTNSLPSNKDTYDQ